MVEREKFSVYIRGLVEGIDRKAISEAFVQFGNIVKVDVIPTRVFFLRIFLTIVANCVC
jgi:hypothetical protein